ncbi:hypothetical protein GLX27_001200 [Malassezia furfur]|uniref:DASH complex subunit DAD3 n=1 Tax=Malassezia furfur TaxID=55194 RepID=A0ABY8EQB3_MALFU|nr:hypothetical protein CBS14141_001132 [Malassezia furfur]WFD46563.1 hypothetical protein GLX27_001200 [Malassezia furfur]
MSATAGDGAPGADFVNPYEGNRSLSSNEQALLGEYARLAQVLRRVAALSTQLSASTTHANVLNDLRVVERKMGLVLTLFKASVWAIVVQQSDDQDEAEWEELGEQYAHMAIPEEDEPLE